MGVVTISAIKADAGGWVGHRFAWETFETLTAVARRLHLMLGDLSFDRARAKALELADRWEPLPEPAGAHAEAAR